MSGLDNLLRACLLAIILLSVVGPGLIIVTGNRMLTWCAGTLAFCVVAGLWVSVWLYKSPGHEAEAGAYGIGLVLILAIWACLTFYIGLAVRPPNCA